MELIVFIAFQLLTEVQSYKSPTVKVFPDVIRESSSVKIICETPADPAVDQCYFYTNREEKNIKNSYRCELDLTGAEVFRWAAVKSQRRLNIYCYYTVLGNDTPSSESPPAKVKVQVSRSTTTKQTTTTAMKTSLPVMSTSKTITYNTTDLHSKTRLSTSMRKETTTSITNSTLAGKNKIAEHISAETSTQKALEIDTAVSSIHTSTAHPTNPQTVSTETSTQIPLQIDTVSATMAITFKKASTITAVSSVHTSTAHPINQHTGTWFIVLVSTGAVILLGLTGLICWFASKRGRKQLIKMEVPSQGIRMSCSGSAEVYSLITSVPETCAGFEHPESHQDSTTDPTDIHSFIMSVNSIYQPSDVLVNKEPKKGNPEENESVHHLYCTIPDKPVHSKAEDHVYSLVKMH